jgi:CBS domain-containing protein
MSRIAQIMTPNPVTILESATVGQASLKMHEHGLRHLPVVGDGDRLVGIISDRDLRGPMVGCVGTAPSTTASVSEIMTRRVISALVDDPLHLAARRMIEHRVGAILVTDADGAVRGIVSYVDVLARLVEDAALDAHAVGLMDRE